NLRSLDPRKADLVDDRLLPTAYEVVLELEPALVGADLRPHRVVAHRQDRRLDAKGALQLEGDVGRVRASLQACGPRDVGRKVPIAPPEARLLAIASEHLGGRVGLAGDPPTLLWVA